MDEEVRSRIQKCREHQLTHLNLRDFGLKQVPEEIFELDQLVELQLSNNQLSSLPDSIDRLRNLQELYLRSNKLTELPASISQLQNLTYLGLSNNQLTALPSWISILTALENLDVSFNQLRNLPSSLGELRKLYYLDLSHNQLQSLPLSIKELENLQDLDVRDNPLELPPLEIVNQGLSAIFNYLGELSDRPENRVYEAKLLLVGEGHVGKTSLLKSLTIPNYVLVENEKRTEGIDIQQWLIAKEELGIDKDFRLNVWDFGGQEIYHQTHQFFLTKRSLYLLVTESRKEDKHEDFYYWFNIIRLLGDRSPVIVVLNKIDEPAKELPISEYQRAFDNIVELQRVSCAPSHRTTIQNLKAAICRILTDKTLMPHIGEPIPGIWVKIRDTLGARRQSGLDYITYTQYLNICRRYGLVEEDRASFLSDYFHNLGVFLHFKDDVYLRETVILNHEWVTDGVYRVLDNPKVIQQRGRFDDSDLIDIWYDEKYRDKRPELLALMKNRKFEICYELPQGGYLAPQLLPVDEPNHYEWRSEESNLHFDYSYEFMPKGILTRFIVKRHREIYQQTHWRYGVLLDFENTRALIREHYFDRKISIVLEGENKQVFLGIIRNTFADIHATFKNLEVKEMVPCNCSSCKSSKTPHFFKYQVLIGLKLRRHKTIPCDMSYDKVNIQSLLNDFEKPQATDNLTPEKSSVDQALVGLRKILINIYETVDDSHRVVQDAGISTSLIDFDQKSINRWHNILRQGHKENKIATIIEIAKSEYPASSDKLQELYQAYVRQLES